VPAEVTPDDNTVRVLRLPGCLCAVGERAADGSLDPDAGVDAEKGGHVVPLRNGWGLSLRNDELLRR
jgi:hypothetical protein